MSSTSQPSTSRRRLRRYTRYPVGWRMFYSDGSFTAAGSILDVTHRGWKLVGRKQVVPGMTLQIRAFPPGKESPLRIEDAKVRWVKGEVFAIEVQKAAQPDRVWLSGYLDEAFSRWLLPTHAKAVTASRESIC